MSDYGYPYLEQQLAADPVQQQVYPHPSVVPVDQAMPPPQTAPQHYLAKLGALLHDHAEQNKSAPAQAPSSSNPYSLNNQQNPYAIEGNSPLAAMLPKKDTNAPDSGAK